MSRFIELHGYDNSGDVSPFLVRLDSITYIEGTEEGHSIICCNTKESWTPIMESYEEMKEIINQSELSLCVGKETDTNVINPGITVIY